MVKEKGNELFFCRVAKMSARVVQISDCHLFTDPSAELRGVQPHRAVLQALQHVTEHETAFDYLVISGDLAPDEQRLPLAVTLKFYPSDDGYADAYRGLCRKGSP